MQKFLTPLAIVIAGLTVAFSNLYKGGKIGISLNSGKVKVGSVSPSPTLAPVLDSQSVREIGAGQSPFLGKADAKVTLIEFSDYQCPFCGAVFGSKNEALDYLKSIDPQWEAPLPKIKKEYVDKGLVKFVYRDFAFLGEESKTAANAALCAGDQAKYWEYHDKLFQNQKGENQGAFKDENLKKWAAELKLEASVFNTCLEKKSHAGEVEANASELRAYAASAKQERLGTPAFFVNGKIVQGGAVSYGILKSLIDQELSK